MQNYKNQNEKRIEIRKIIKNKAWCLKCDDITYTIACAVEEIYDYEKEL